jgi:hypothetical protein
MAYFKEWYKGKKLENKQPLTIIMDTKLPLLSLYFKESLPKHVENI